MIMKKIAYITNNIAPFRVMLLDQLAEYAEVTLFYVSELDAGVNPDYVKLRPQKAKLQSISEQGLGKTFQDLKSMDVVLFDGYSGKEKLQLICRMIASKRSYGVSIDGLIPKEKVGFKQRLVNSLKSFVLSHADFVLSTNGPTDQAIFQLAPKAKIKRHIFSTLSQADFVMMEQVDKEQIRQRYKLDAKKTNILFVGKFNHGKGIDCLASLIKDYRFKEDVHFTLVGGTQQELDQLGIELSTNATLIPFLEKEDILQLMTTMDLFVLPTHSDTWGLVVVESLSAGLPVVTTRFCNAGVELIAEGENGYLMDAVTVEQLKQAVEQAVDLDPVQVLSYNHKLMQNYHLEGAAKRLMMILEEMYG